MAGKLTVLLLDGVFIKQSCVNGLSHLLNSSLTDLKVETCSSFEKDFDDLITSIAQSELKQLYFKNLRIHFDQDLSKSLARLLTQSKTLEKVTVLELDPMDCKVTRTLIKAMTHSSTSVKYLVTNQECRDAVADDSYPRDKVTFA